jgi:hypothetical protein
MSHKPATDTRTNISWNDYNGYWTKHPLYRKIMMQVTLYVSQLAINLSQSPVSRSKLYQTDMLGTT